MKAVVNILLSKAVQINRFTSLAPRLLCLAAGAGYEASEIVTGHYCPTCERNLHVTLIKEPVEKKKKKLGNCCLRRIPLWSPLVMLPGSSQLHIAPKSWEESGNEASHDQLRETELKMRYGSHLLLGIV